MKKTLIFIDGQNLFYSLKDMELKESQINWDLFMDGLIEPDDELVRTYWYQPQGLNDPRVDFSKAKRILERKSPSVPASEINKQAAELMKKAKDWTRVETEKYQRQLHRYDEFSIKYPRIEMVRKGVVKIDPFKQIYLGEKGIDVALAVNMIKFHDKCEKIILVSGDLDYAEAIQYIKDNLKRVHIVKLFKGEPPINRSVSRALMALADKVIDIYETEIRSKYLLPVPDPSACRAKMLIQSPN
jgi:uncharacterized LabA/DUF88 family protein